jgi:N-acyl-L-homoserine lactone synthetase
MIHIVTAANKKAYVRALGEMFQDRKRVFADALKCDVRVIAGEFEVDRFDTDDAVYLIELDEHTGRHRASGRILPTTKPSSLEDVFATLDGDFELPHGNDTWELSRFIVSPDVEGSQVRRHLHRLWKSAVGYAAAHQIVRYTFVVPVSMLSMILSAGWDIEPLGLPQTIRGAQLAAMIAHVRRSPKNCTSLPYCGA